MNGQQRVGMFSALAGVAILLGGLVAPSRVTATNDDDNDHTVTICHASGLEGTTKFETITIDRHAAFGQAGHFYENGTPRAGHEQDYLGACHPVVTTTTAEVTTTTAEVTTTTAEVTTTTAEATTTTAKATTTTATPTSVASESPTIPTTIASAGPVPTSAVLEDSGALPTTGGVDAGLPLAGGVLLFAGLTLLGLARRPHAS